MTKDRDAEVLKKARTFAACTFRVGGVMQVAFNHGRDRVAFDKSFLRPFAYSVVKDGDPLAKSWEADGWHILSNRLSWRLSPHAIQFSTPEGKYQITRMDLHDWYEGIDNEKNLPQLERVK